MALAYLRQAAEVRRVEQLERQAGRLGQMLEELSARQKQVAADPASPAAQAEAAEQLEAAAQQLGAMTSPGDGGVREATREAEAAAGEAAQKFAAKEGRPEDLDKTMEAVAEAQKQSLGEAEHAAAMLEEVGRLLAEAQRIAALVEKEPAKIESRPVEEWIAAFQKRRTTLAKQLAAAVGDQWDDTLSPIRPGEVTGGGTAIPTRLEPMTPIEVGQMAEALASAEVVLRERLRLLSQRDLLDAMQAQDVPREYREQVTAYFLKLSRTADAAAEPAAGADGPRPRRDGQ